MKKSAARAGFACILLLEILGRFILPDIASDFTWLGLIVTTLFAWSVVEAFRLSAFMLWLALAAVILDGLSALFQLYSHFQLWDLWMHVVGGLVIAAAALELVLRGLREKHVSARRHGPFIIATVLLTVAAVGFLYEFWEYLVDRVQYGYPKSLVSAYDSVEDQLANLTGAAAALAVHFLWRARAAKRPASPLSAE